MSQTAALHRPAKSAGRVLHVGAGNATLIKWFENYEEVKLDICVEYKPDIVADMTAMGEIGQYEAISCSHSLEHLHPEAVDQALHEFIRVLRPGGVAIIYVPDLEDIKPNDEVLYQSAAGPITGHDMYFGYSPYVADNPRMAHQSGFTKQRLTAIMERAGFAKVIVQKAFYLQLLAVGVKSLEA